MNYPRALAEWESRRRYRNNPPGWRFWRGIAKVCTWVGFVLVWPGAALLDLADECDRRAWCHRSARGAKDPRPADPNFVRATIVE